MMCSAIAVANYFIQEHPGEISHLKLQKLVYISHGWHLGIYDTPLVEDELTEAWRHGPVFPSLYYSCKKFGSKPIDKLVKDVDEKDGVPVLVVPKICDPRKINLLCGVWKGYGHLTGFDLSELTHRDGTPWFNTWEENPGMRNLNIKNKDIENHYKEKLKSQGES